MEKRERRSYCPIGFGLDIFGDKWTLLVVRDLMFKGKYTYGEFLSSEEKIATNILADRLQKLSDAGIVVRQAVADKRVKYRYMLSQKGIDLLPVLVELILWSAKHDPHTAADEAFVRGAHEAKVALLEKIRATLRADLAEVAQ